MPLRNRRADRRPLHLQQLLVAGVADELAVLLKGRHPDDALAQFRVADGNAEPVGLGQHASSSTICWTMRWAMPSCLSIWSSMLPPYAEVRLHLLLVGARYSPT